MFELELKSLSALSKCARKQITNNGMNRNKKVRRMNFRMLKLEIDKLLFFSDEKENGKQNKIIK